MAGVSNDADALDFDSLLAEGEGMMGSSAEKDQSERVLDIELGRIRPFELNRALTEEQVKKAAEELAAEDWVLLHPVVLVPDDSGKADYVVISGEKRWRAFRHGGMETIKSRIFEGMTARELHRKNIKANTEIEEEDLPTLAVRIKVYKETHNLSNKEVSEDFKKSQGYISDYINHFSQLREIPLVRDIYDVDGVTDMLLLKHLIMIHKKSDSAARSIVGFGKANGCFNRDFVLGAYKLDLYGDIEAQLRTWLANGLTKEALNQAMNEEGELTSPSSAIDDESSANISPGKQKDEEQLDIEDAINSDIEGIHKGGSGDEYEEEPQGDDIGGSEDDDFDEHEEDVESGSPVKKRALSKAEISVQYEGDNYFLALDLVADEEDKIVIRSVSGKLSVVDPALVKISYVS